MDRLPQDPIMLLSSINMLLRDREYDSLEDLCGRFDRDINEVKTTLLQVGYEYDEKLKQFK
ncbi:MAG: DUF4250 domain-containing protein [Bacteroidaceae bacterium]|nr:DUF4250 domain-containing protein [Bacteroidaceae bacterium]